jgi:hypothetical protein
LEHACVDELGTEVVEILGERGLLNELLDDGGEVAQAAYGLEVLIDAAECSACEGEDEGAVHDFEIDAAPVESECGPSVLSQDAAQGSRELLVSLEDAVDVLGLC